MPTNNKPTGGRINKPLHIMLPPDERQRLDAYADKVGRPLSWVVRDGLRVYLEAAEAAADRLASVRVDPGAIGWTVQPRRGRPPADTDAPPPGEKG